MASVSIGDPLTRVDGFDKVTGRMKFVAELYPHGVLHAALVGSDVPAGRITAVHDEAAKGAPGVRLVLTHRNMDPLEPLPGSGPVGGSGKERQPLQSDHIRHYGQHLALVVADTPEQAQHAASLVRFEIAREPFDLSLAFDDSRKVTPENQTTKIGDAQAAFAASPKKHEAIYTTPTEHHNPIEPVATVADWVGDELHLYETSRQIKSMQTAIAASFGMPKEKVHLSCPCVGGSFGSKGFSYGHILMTAVAARKLKRPVRLVTTRRQMFADQGHRPRTIQQVSLGADAEGHLKATRHLSTNDTAPGTSFIENCALTTQKLYRTETLETIQGNVALALPPPCPMRAPGEAPGPFALESAMDELAYELGIDPVELRLRNDQTTDPKSAKPWSIRHFRECFEQASERFGWARRDPKPRSMREGRELIGWGCAGVAYRANRSGTSVRAVYGTDGIAVFQMAASDVGQGHTTAMTQVVAATLGLPMARVRVESNDSDFPQAPGAGGSGTATSVGSALVEAANALKAKVGDMSRLPVQAVEVKTSTEVKLGEKPVAFSSWGAVFAEVRVDEDLGTIRCRRFVGVYDIGKAINARMVRSQLQSGIVWAIGMALQEHTVIDERRGMYVNRDLAEYHIPVNADVPAIDVSWLDILDPEIGPLGGHGVGEIGIAGAPAAIANAVFHATGKRVRDLPITLDKLL